MCGGERRITYLACSSLNFRYLNPAQRSSNNSWLQVRAALVGLRGRGLPALRPYKSNSRGKESGRWKETGRRRVDMHTNMRTTQFVAFFGLHCALDVIFHIFYYLFYRDKLNLLIFSVLLNSLAVIFIQKTIANLIFTILRCQPKCCASSCG